MVENSTHFKAPRAFISLKHEESTLSKIPEKQSVEEAKSSTCNPPELSAPILPYTIQKSEMLEPSVVLQHLDKESDSQIKGENQEKNFFQKLFNFIPQEQYKDLYGF